MFDVGSVFDEYVFGNRFYGTYMVRNKSRIYNISCEGASVYFLEGSFGALHIYDVSPMSFLVNHQNPFIRNLNNLTFPKYNKLYKIPQRQCSRTRSAGRSGFTPMLGSKRYHEMKISRQSEIAKFKTKSRDEQIAEFLTKQQIRKIKEKHKKDN